MQEKSMIRWQMPAECLDWEAQWACAMDPETAKKVRDDRKPEHEDTCSMCGKFCAVRKHEQSTGRRTYRYPLNFSSLKLTFLSSRDKSAFFTECEASMETDPYIFLIIRILQPANYLIFLNWS